MNKTLKAGLCISLLLLVIVAGCTTMQVDETSDSSTQLTGSEVEQVFDDFEDSLLDETDDIEIGSLI